MDYRVWRVLIRGGLNWYSQLEGQPLTAIFQFSIAVLVQLN